MQCEICGHEDHAHHRCPSAVLREISRRGERDRELSEEEQEAESERYAKRVRAGFALLSLAGDR